MTRGYAAVGCPPMRRLARHLFTLCAALSLLLCVAVCLLWWRGEYASESIGSSSGTGRLQLGARTTPGASTLCTRGTSWQISRWPRRMGSHTTGGSRLPWPAYFQERHVDWGGFGYWSGRTNQGPAYYSRASLVIPHWADLPGILGRARGRKYRNCRDRPPRLNLASFHLDEGRKGLLRA
jgi:hypothetical protein